MPLSRPSRRGTTALIGGVWKPVTAMIALGLLSGFYTVNAMEPQGPPPPPPGALVEAPAATLQPRPVYSMFGSAPSQDSGYQWAQMARIVRIEECPDAAPSFRQGCARYLADVKENGGVVVQVGYAPRPRHRARPRVADEPAVEAVSDPIATDAAPVETATGEAPAETF